LNDEIYLDDKVSILRDFFGFRRTQKILLSRKKC